MVLNYTGNDQRYAPVLLVASELGLPICCLLPGFYFILFYFMKMYFLLTFLLLYSIKYSYISLQSLQGQLCSAHLRISILKQLRELVSFIFAGTISQILDPK